MRIRDCNGAAVRASGRYVLYWMIASRRLAYNFALDRALQHCRELAKPVLIFEALRCDYPWASDRFHRFVLDGMAGNASICARHGIFYYPYVEPAPQQSHGLLEALAADACVVVTDDFPAFFLPRMIEAASKKLPVRLEAVDSNGLLPMRATTQAFTRAFDFRRFLQKQLPAHLSQSPVTNPLSSATRLPRLANLPKSILSRWPAADADLLNGKPAGLGKLPIDHRVAQTEIRAGSSPAKRLLRQFLEKKLARYVEQHNEPELDATSHLSPYLHFGQISAYEIFSEIVRCEKWDPERLSLCATGSREGWWNMSAGAESFLDQLITWRELALNFCAHRTDYHQFASLPAWAQKTLHAHSKDRREHLYSLDQFESAQTHDPLWNAGQIQLLREGRIHNYLRMLWGKKILEWSRSPEEAARIMIHLNDKYALDGRDPNSYSGIFWVLGRYDRPWGPERPVFGLVRYMSSENAARKVSVKNYIRKYSQDRQPALPR
jgi:deoxyribodipyrimidine photo-lyase